MESFKGSKYANLRKNTPFGVFFLSHKEVTFVEVGSGGNVGGFLGVRLAAG